VLTGAQIQRRGIVALDERSVAAHVQPNGIDLSLDAIWQVDDAGALGARAADRRLPARAEVPFDADGWVQLGPGSYGLRYGEQVTLPVDCGALCFPRSSLLRMGLHVPTAVWDAGYDGRGEGLLVVLNPHGVRLQRGARIAQLVVFELAEAVAQGYAGRYQHEGR
jgi:dUTP pyrophosphatase